MGLDTLKSIGPLEGMTLGAAVGGPVGAIVGGVFGLANKGIQFWKPNFYEDFKDGAYKLYDEKSESVKKTFG
ncbi:hypothetical protein ACWN8P_05940 [Vagococcus salmoninarum]|uniref:Uncharacterized protein n=1 Tax=Vagococcus salmoninarum TaxID=2739 RepID=A0A429ZQ04_9ENTE|nr:hypothetical protein [Vagococcus salmoninarum]RST95777.1 hypothetical protein CBF35_07365 [Vagococcus salmoninarum]